VGLINGELACHTGIIQFPLRKGWKRVHRFVVLPDYQGIGIGMNFINEICNQYKQKEFNVNLTTTTPSLVGALTRDKKWLLKRFGRSVDNQNSRKKTNVRMLKSLTKSSSKKRITYSFNYKNKSIT
jgi:GNAT superfamily N-acetyltransferase